MNLAGCANCLLHGWKQVENLSSLQRCKKCKQVQYCGRDCQAEHWERVHKKQCRYFADPVKAHKWGHKEDECTICLQAHEVGQTELCRATNPNYECIFKEKFPPHMYHPHPFPVTGQPGHTYEKAIIILWQLLKKLELTQPKYRGKLIKVFAEVKMIRLEIWSMRKIGGQFECLHPMENMGPPSLDDLLDIIEKELGMNDSMKDLYLTIQLVNWMVMEVFLCESLLVLINPLADIPPDLQMIVSQALSNTTNYLTVANQVLEALATQVVPYLDLVRIICGGTLEKRCIFCSENLTVGGIFCSENITVASTWSGIREKGAAFFNCLFMGIYRCGADACYANAMNMMIQDYVQVQTAVLTTVQKRKNAQLQCDFCLKLPPSKEGHRCSKCLSVMYCSVACRDKDRQIHKDFCKEEVEERKKKFGGSERRKEARDVLDDLEERFERIHLEELAKGVNFPGLSEVVSKIKLKDPSKKQK